MKQAKTHGDSRRARLTASSFESLSDAAKNQILAEIEAQTPEQRLAESRPLTAKERAQWNAFRTKALKNRKGRPKVGKGSAVISLSIEKGFLKRADAYAKRNGLGRSEMFVQAVSGLIGGQK